MNRTFTKSILSAALSLLAVVALHAQESETAGKIKIQITREIDGETKTFNGEYENEEQMRNDPALKEFQKGDDDFQFQFLNTNDPNRIIDIQSFNGPGGPSFKINNSFQFSMDSMMTMTNGHMAKIEEQMKALEEQFGNMNFYFDWVDSLDESVNQKMMKVYHFDSDDNNKTVEIMIIDGDEMGKKGQVKKSDALLLESIDYYPNPSHGRFNLTFKVPGQGELSVKVFNLSGQTVYSRYFDQFGGTYSEMIDLSDQKEGLYLLEVQFDGKRLTRKVVVE